MHRVKAEFCTLHFLRLGLIILPCLNLSGSSALTCCSPFCSLTPSVTSLLFYSLAVIRLDSPPHLLCWSNTPLPPTLLLLSQPSSLLTSLQSSSEVPSAAELVSAIEKLVKTKMVSVRAGFLPHAWTEANTSRVHRFLQPCARWYGAWRVVHV